MPAAQAWGMGRGGKDGTHRSLEGGNEGPLVLL